VLLGLELVVVDVLDDAVLVQHVGLPPRERPEQVPGHAPLLAHPVPLVAQQRERQPVLLRERLVRHRVVAADAQHLRAGLLELLVRVAERARLRAAAAVSVRAGYIDCCSWVIVCSSKCSTDDGDGYKIIITLERSEFSWW
jgi:hypothetical protein